MRVLFGLFLMVVGVFMPAQAVVVLQYHHTAEDTPSATSTRPDLFRWQMQWLKDNQFQVVSWARVKEALDGGLTLPDKSVLITFDDGYISVLENAVPLLEKYDYPYLIFVNPGLIGNRDSGMMGWSTLKQLMAKKATIGNHTFDHPYLLNRESSESQAAYLQRIQWQIVTAEKKIYRQLGEAEKVLAWPYGEYSSPLLAVAKKLNYYAFGQQSGVVSPLSDPQALPRFPMGAGYGTEKDFPTKLMALAMPVKSAVLQTDTNSIVSNSIVAKDRVRSSLRLVFRLQQAVNDLHCFYHAEVLSVKRLSKKEFKVMLPQLSISRRQRVNCTAPSSFKGRYFWYSHPIFMPWVRE